MALRLREVAQASDGHGGTMPADAEFRVDVTQERGGVRVRPVGDVDVATIGRLRERMNEAMAAAGERVILDLRATTFLDSTGLHLVVDTDSWATRTGTEFVIIAGPPAVQHTFDLAGLSGRLPFVDGTQSLAYASGIDRLRSAP
jgi:anti-sigma B factor antagonist